MNDIDGFVNDDLGGNKEDAHHLFSIFLTEMQQMMLSLSNACKDKDKELFKETLHNVKGISLSLRLYDLSSPVSQFYEQLKKENTLDLSIAFHKIENAFSQTKKEISSFLSNEVKLWTQ